MDLTSWTTYAPIAIVVLVLIISSLTNRQMSFVGLFQSQYTPPPYVFAIVWSVLYILITFSWVFSNASTPANFELINWLFVINIILNLSWSILFFGDNQIVLGLIIILLMIISVVWILYELRDNPVSFWSLVPYLIWLCVAFCLNYYIVNHNLVLNTPTGNVVVSARA